MYLKWQQKVTCPPETVIGAISSRLSYRISSHSLHFFSRCSCCHSVLGLSTLKYVYFSSHVKGHVAILSIHHGLPLSVAPPIKTSIHGSKCKSHNACNQNPSIGYSYDVKLAHCYLIFVYGFIHGSL
jgi:hypothetical protein